MKDAPTGPKKIATESAGSGADSLIEFPSELTVRAMGPGEADFEADIAALVQSVIGPNVALQVSSRDSSKGTYRSVNVTFIAADLVTLEAVYAALRDDQRVLYLL